MWWRALAWTLKIYGRHLYYRFQNVFSLSLSCASCEFHAEMHHTQYTLSLTHTHEHIQISSGVTHELIQWHRADEKKTIFRTVE